MSQGPYDPPNQDEIDELESALRHVALIATETFVREYYGDRCDDFDPLCTLCRKWRAFDELFELNEDSG